MGAGVGRKSWVGGKVLEDIVGKLIYLCSSASANWYRSKWSSSSPAGTGTGSNFLDDYISKGWLLLHPWEKHSWIVKLAGVWETIHISKEEGKNFQLQICYINSYLKKKKDSQGSVVCKTVHLKLSQAEEILMPSGHPRSTLFSLSSLTSELFSLWKASESFWFSLNLVSCSCIFMCLVSQWCPTLSDPLDCSPPDYAVYGISHTRTLERVAISYSRGIFPT